MKRSLQRRQWSTAATGVCTEAAEMDVMTLSSALRPGLKRASDPEFMCGSDRGPPTRLREPAMRLLPLTRIACAVTPRRPASDMALALGLNDPPTAVLTGIWYPLGLDEELSGNLCYLE